MKRISDGELRMVGQQVASLWGACCTGFERKKDSVVFYCNECGEKFITELTYDEVQEELEEA